VAFLDIATVDHQFNLNAHLVHQDHLVHLDQLETQEALASLEILDHQDNQDHLALHQIPVAKSVQPDHPVNLEAKVHLDHLEEMDNLVDLDKEAAKVLLDRPVHPDRLVVLDNLVDPVSLDQLEILELEALLFLDQRDRLETLVALDSLEVLEDLVNLEDKDPPVHLDHLEHPEAQVNLVAMVNLVLKDNQDTMEPIALVHLVQVSSLVDHESKYKEKNKCFKIMEIQELGIFYKILFSTSSILSIIKILLLLFYSNHLKLEF
jgi:hypothetical protein